MAETTEYDPTNIPPLMPSAREQKPLGSLVAAAKRMSGKKVTRPGNSAKAEGWQEDAWDMYDLVGEHRFLATTLANRLSQARLFVGTLPDDPTEGVEPETTGAAYDVFNTIEQSGTSLDQIVGRLGINLFVAGDGWLIGVPRDKPETGTPDLSQGITPVGSDGGSSTIDISDLDWHMMSVSEVTTNQSGEISLAGRSEKTYKADDLWMIRVWRPHPRKWEQADSPTRSSLPVLRELVGLTMHISAQVDSRLAGAGVLFIPQSADRAMRAAAGLPENGDDESPFVTALMEAMLTPISDRASASALVPLMPVLPDESIDKFRYMTFAGALDAEARELRDEAIRRLALGLDCPPELLLGVGGMNHWGAWLVREDVVTTHLEPPLALICDALTTEFLWPVLEQQGMEPEEARKHVIWYDVDHLVMRPNRTEDAKSLHDKKVITDKALRDAAGFDESDAPEIVTTMDDPAVTAALDLAKAAPSLAQNPGLPALVEQIRALYAGTATDAGTQKIADALVDEAAPADTTGAEDIPNPEDSAGPEDETAAPSIAASAGWMITDEEAEEALRESFPKTPVYIQATHGGTSL